MRALLIIPTHLYPFEWPSLIGLPDYPIGMAYVASALKAAGHKVAVCNLNNAPEFPSARAMVKARLTNAIHYDEPDVILTGGLSAEFECLSEIVKLCRLEGPSVPLVLGGGIVTHDADYVFNRLRPDFAIIGEAESAAESLLLKLSKGEHDYEAIPNVMFWRNSKPVPSEETKAPENLETLAWPDYSIFGDFNRWALNVRLLHRYPREKPRHMTVVAGRSCPFRCTFCIHERRPVPYRARSIPDVIRELEHMMGRYPFNVLTILDELFTARPERLREFSQLILDRHLDFSWSFQTHCSARLDVETLKLAKAAGCYMFSYGVESVSPAVIASMNKKSTPERITEGVEAARTAHVGFSANLIFGDPAETAATVEESLSYFDKHLRSEHMWLSSVQPYPGSRLFHECLENGVIPGRDLFYDTVDQRRYNMTRMPSWSWMPWIAIVNWLGAKGLWLDEVPVKRLERTFAEDGTTTLFVSDCPHCSKETRLVQFATARIKARAVTIPQNPIVQWIAQQGNKCWFAKLVRMVAMLLSKRYPWWGSIVRLIPPGADPSAIRAACPHCNRAFRISQ